MKKIAFVSSNEWMPWGGSEELWSQTALRLREDGFTVGVNVKKWDDEDARIKRLENSGCAVERRVWWPKRSILKRIINRFYTLRIPYDWFDKFRPDLIVISKGNFAEGIEWSEACVKKDIPFITITHGVLECCWPTDEVSERLIAVCNNAKRCFFVSERSIDLAETQLGIKILNAGIVRNPFGVPYDRRPSWPAPDPARMACVGTLEPATKGQDILFKVLSLKKWRERQIKISVFGKGYMRNCILRIKDGLKLDNVELAGIADNIESIWQTHHALILPSRYEGMPIVTVEAMLCGRVCIVTDVGGNAELIKDNVSGFIAKAPIPDLVDEAMERAWQRRGSWQDIGNEAADAIRRIIPRDPVGEFVKTLKNLI